VKALDFLTKSAEMGYRDAQWRLGTFYFHYSKSDYDKKTSFNWIQKAAKSGHIEAQTRLGCFLEFGHGTAISHNRAFRYYHLAAQKGDPEAQYHVGRLYLMGQGVQTNNELVEYWLIKSSNNGFTMAEELLNSQYVDCPECNVAGYRTCRDCDGDGSRHFRSCDGYRRDRNGKTCLACDGTGLVSCNRTVQCSKCLGQGKGVMEICPNCSGTGEVTLKDGSIGICGENFGDYVTQSYISANHLLFGTRSEENYC
jgi:hypothetical protein